jgi:hypothetical protein
MLKLRAYHMGAQSVPDKGSPTKKGPKMAKKTINKSAVTGKIVTESYLKSHPKTTFKGQPIWF